MLTFEGRQTVGGANIVEQLAVRNQAFSFILS